MTSEDQKKRNREYMRAYRERTGHSHDKKFRIKHREVIKAKRAIWYANNKEQEDARLARRMKWKGKYIFLDKKPLTKICSVCKKSVDKGEIPYTSYHHTQYDAEHPERHTVEICPKCHKLEHLKTHVYSMTTSAVQMRDYRARKKQIGDKGN